MYGMTSIVILSYNTLELLQMCVESIRAFTDLGTYEIIVVENASTDGSVEWLKMQDDIRCIFNEENAGFPKGCNQGMEIARGNSILLLNSDTIVTPRWLNQLRKALYSSDDIGAVGCVTNRCSNYQIVEIPYTDINDMLPFADGFNHSNKDKWVESFKLIGFCMLFKREIYNKIGGLDERFTPGNFEDDDYSLRIRLEGYRLLLCEDTFIHHFGSASFLKKRTLEEEQLHREKYIKLLRCNAWKFCHKWNISDMYNRVDGVVDYCLDNFVNDGRVLFIGSYSMAELMIIHKYNQNIKLEYITDNELDWKTNTTYLKKYNCVNIVDEAGGYLSGEYDFIVVDDGIMKYDNALDFIFKLKNYVKNSNNIFMRKYNLLKYKMQIQKLNHKKIAFITMVSDEGKYAEALKNWKQLNVPKWMQVDYIAVRDAASMTEGCNKGMIQSDAKYKIYVHQDVFFENKNFLNILVNSFKKDKNYGIAGVIGCRRLPIDAIWWNGYKENIVGGVKLISSNKCHTVRVQKEIQDPMIVDALDGLLVATQYDIPWRSDLFDKWHFYDISQCMEFKKRGYKAIILPQKEPLCLHKSSNSNTIDYHKERLKFIDNYVTELADLTD